MDESEHTARLGEPPSKLQIDPRALEARVSQAITELGQSAEYLRGLATTIDDISADLPRDASSERLRQVAIGVQATTIQAVMGAMGARSLAERLATLAAVKDLADAEVL